MEGTQDQIEKTLCVIFDMDGVIVDSEPLHMKCEREIFDMLGIIIPPDEHHSFAGLNDEAMWNRIRMGNSLPLTNQELINLKRKKYLELLDRSDAIKIIPYVRQVIIDLFNKGFYLTLASSSPKEQIDYILNKFKLEAYFHARISGDDVENGKPDPEIFLRAARLVNIKPDRCVVIEDSYNGILAAKNAGMKCIGYRNLNSGNQIIDSADIIIDTFNDFPLTGIEELLQN